VINFEGNKFKIYAKPEFDVAEPILEEEELSRTNHHIEMKKQGFSTV
jgi:hypothetical protein